MCDNIYFNEPGKEDEVLTKVGLARNEGYRNIVKYANLKYAILE